MEDDCDYLRLIKKYLPFKCIIFFVLFISTVMRIQINVSFFSKIIFLEKAL